jgi:hypothetical protein
MGGWSTKPNSDPFSAGPCGFLIRSSTVDSCPVLGQFPRAIAQYRPFFFDERLISIGATVTYVRQSWEGYLRPVEWV